MSNGRLTLIIALAAVVAIVAVVVTSGGIGLGDGDAPTNRSGVGKRDAPSDDGASAEDLELPENPDDVRGTNAYALTRAANLRRALAVLERERQPVEGVYDGLRIAPGRIDTIIIHPTTA